MVTAAIVCAAAGLALLLVGGVWLASDARSDASAGGWRERASDTAADFRDWLRLGR
jgi:hypothetical protein